MQGHHNDCWWCISSLAASTFSGYIHADKQSHLGSSRFTNKVNRSKPQQIFDIAPNVVTLGNNHCWSAAGQQMQYYPPFRYLNAIFIYYKGNTSITCRWACTFPLEFVVRAASSSLSQALSVASLLYSRMLQARNSLNYCTVFWDVSTVGFWMPGPH